MNIEIMRPENLSYLDQYRKLGYSSKTDMVEEALEMLRDTQSHFPDPTKGQLRRIDNAKRDLEKGNYITNAHADKLVDEWLNT